MRKSKVCPDVGGRTGGPLAPPCLSAPPLPAQLLSYLSTLTKRAEVKGAMVKACEVLFDIMTS